MKIELCSSSHPKDGFKGLDIIPSDGVEFVVDLNKGVLPFESNSIEEFYEENGFYELNNPMQIIRECHRCLVCGGILEIKEMHFSSPYAYIPYTKNFWGFNTQRLFTKGYRGGVGWEIVEVDFELGFENRFPLASMFLKWLINLDRGFYEKYMCRFFPIFVVSFKLRKRCFGE